MAKNYPTWWKTACLELSENDKIMSRLIEVFNDKRLNTSKNPFFSLAKSIVGQQISVQAADAIWKRLEERYNIYNENCFVKAEIKDLREIGLSQRKSTYLINLSVKLKNKNNFSFWNKLNDEEVYDKLILFKGIGPWSIKMFLIFCLNRPDVFSKEDIGLVKAIGKNYYNGDRPSIEEVEELSLCWRPWRTVASWFLWRSIDPNVVSY